MLLSRTSVDLTPFLGAGAGSIAVRDRSVVWNAVGRTTVLDDAVPYRMGPGLAIVRPTLSASSSVDGFVHRLPVFERPVTERVLGPLRAPDREDARPMPLVAIAVPLVAGVVGALAFGRPEFLIISAMAPIASLATWSSERSRSRKRSSVEQRRFDEEVAAVVAQGAAFGTEVSRSAHDDDPDLAALYRAAVAGDGRIWDRDVNDQLSVRIGTAPGRIPVALGADPTSHGFGALSEQMTQLRGLVETVSDLPVSVELTCGPTAGAMALVGPDAMLGDGVRAVIAQLACRYPPSQLRLEGLDHPIANSGRWLPHVMSGRLASGDQAVRLRLDVDPSNGPLPTTRPNHPTIWVTNEPRRVPRWCDTVVTFSGGDRPGTATALVRTRAGDRTVEPDRLDAIRFDELARALAPLREAAMAADVRRSGLLELLDAPDPRGVQQRWALGERTYALQMTVGEDATGPITFDLVSDGPHVLVAGTTGSGKSMLLQTMLLSLAAAHPPGRVQFLGIDYKGGATFHPLRDLPHCAGVVTNLDGALAERVLVSLGAELDRRMRLLDGRASDLAGLRSIDPQAAPPSLVIVVDEFAAVVREAPGFLDAMVDLAQRGRSLGLHLVLATQRPTGAVNDAILANTSIRIAMRTADAAESIAIIGDRCAADLDGPGRGLLRRGAGAPIAFEVPDLERRTCEPAEITTWPMESERPAPEQALDGPSDAGRLLDLIQTAARGLPGGTRLWLDPLPDDLPWTQLRAVAPFAAGFIDRPERQEIVALEPPDRGVLLVCGAHGSGRSNALAAIVRCLRHRHHGSISVQMVDWSGRSPVHQHTEPDVLVGPAQMEPLIRLIQLLERRVESHRHQVTHGTDDDDGPTVDVVVLDDITPLLEDLQSIDHGHWITVLARAMREASASGVLFAVGALRQRDLPAAMVGTVATIWQLRPGHVDDLTSTVLPGTTAGSLLSSSARIASTPSMPPGRIVVDGHWAQIARIDTEPVRHGRYPGPPSLPDRWSLGSDPTPEPGGIVVGIADLSFETVTAPVSGHIAIVGPALSGRTNAIEAVLRQWRSSRRVLLSGASSRLGALPEWEDHLVYGDVGFPGPLRDLMIDGGDLLVVVDDVDELPDSAGAALDALANDRRVTFVAAGTPIRFERAFSGWLAEVKRSGRFLVLQPERPSDVEQITGRRVRLRPDQPMVPGRGMWVDRRAATLVQVPLAAGPP
ncbi:MAG: FtsK/SpoIIIE domain-containing protein [Acidimicrobiia bacterium]